MFQVNTEVGKDVSTADLREEFDAVVLCLGATWPRDLPIPGRELKVQIIREAALKKELF